MLTIAYGQNVFGPDDIQQLEAALKYASDHFRTSYGFTGKSLKAAETIAASAIFRHRRDGVRSVSKLVDAATEAVRQWLKGECIVKVADKPVRRPQRQPKSGFVWVNYKRAFPEAYQEEALREESERSTRH